MQADLRRLLPCLVCLLLAGSASAEPLVVGPEARTALGLTVYSQESLALVRDVRRAEMPAGPTVLRFRAVPEQLDPRTVALRATSGAPVGVLDQSFRYDLAGGDQLLARWLGKTVDLVETDEQLRTQTTPAELLALGPPPVYRVGDRILLGHPGRVALPPLGSEVFLEPTLSWSVRAKATGARELEATYATSGLGWEADYALVLADTTSPTTAHLTGWTTLRNDTHGTFERATVSLVAGRLNRAARPIPMAEGMRFKAADMAVAAAAPTEEPVLDYHRYALPDPVTLAPHETKQIHLLSADEVRVERRYRVNGPGLWPGGQSAGEDEQTLPVEIRLVLVNDPKQGLGQPLPAGIVRVHAPTPSGTVEFAGEDRIGHVAKNERIELTVGEASDLVAKRRETEYRQTGTKPFGAEVAALVTLRNQTDSARTVDVREPVAGSWKVIESSHEAERVNARTLGFTVTVPAGGSVELRYRLQLGQ